jgi:hypothetical protein
MLIFKGNIMKNNPLISSNESVAAQEQKQLLQEALIYAFENTNQDMDYSKYIHKDFSQVIDGTKFTYETSGQTHIKHIPKA